MDDAEQNVLAYMPFPKEHRAKLLSTNPIEHFNGEIKRRTDVVGNFSNDDANRAPRHQLAMSGGNCTENPRSRRAG